MTENLAFYFLAIVAVTSAFFVVSAKNPTSGVLSFVVTIFALSGLFALLSAHFVAMIQILIYAGAILVLFLFILMLIGMDGNSENAEVRSGLKRLTGIVLIISFLAEFDLVLFSLKTFSAASPFISGTVEQIGRTLCKWRLLPFELVSLLLLVGLIGVVNLTKREKLE